MSANWRHWLFFPAVAVLAGLLLWGMAGMPAFGHYRGPYGTVLNQVTLAERHVTNVVSAVTFDYRGFDTLGEEFILFASVIGVTVLLRELRGEAHEDVPDEWPGREVPPTSDAVRTVSLGLIGPLLLFGFYIIAHGHLSPGGGFQGGVLLATALLLAYLAGTVQKFQDLTSHTLLEGLETAALGFFVLLGLTELLLSSGFLNNVLPLGQVRAVNSGGHIPLLNLATGLAVAGGLLLLFKAFLEQALELRRDGDR